MDPRLPPEPLRTVRVGDRDIPTDSEGYLRNLQDWSEDFARALAKEEKLDLTPAHWQVIRFLRDYYQEHGVQAQVRVMIRHFSDVWDEERGSNDHRQPCRVSPDHAMQQLRHTHDRQQKDHRAGQRGNLLPDQLQV